MSYYNIEPFIVRQEGKFSIEGKKMVIETQVCLLMFNQSDTTTMHKSEENWGKMVGTLPVYYLN